MLGDTDTEFPKSIEEFGYKFNENGELRNIKTNERFLFFVKDEDRSYNQKHYEALGDVIGDFIEDELVDKYKLVRTIIPVGSEEDDSIAKSRIYLSNDAQECQTLLLIIQGSGVVRPGQWARQVIINESLELGTMFPYISKALELKWGIIIFNPNENYGRITKNGGVFHSKVPDSGSSKEHCLYVWDQFVKNSKAEKILIVAHSYGGICTTYMIDEFGDEFKSRVKGIALTDSVHSRGMIPLNSREWFNRNSINWIKSSLPLNENVVEEASQYYGCRCLSAGHPKHEYTSGCAIEAVFAYLQGRGKCHKEKASRENKTDEQSLVANNGSKAIVDESPKPDTSSMEVDTTISKEESSPKAEINMQTQETSSEKVTKATEAPTGMQTQENDSKKVNTAMETDDESPNKLDTAENASDNPTEALTSDKNIEPQEIVMNDNENAIEGNNTSENQVVTIEDVSKETVTDSTQAKNDSTTKESFQENNNSIREQTENLTTSDQKNI